MANRFLGSLLALTAMAGTPLWAAAAEHGAAESADVAKAVNPLDFVWQTGTWTAVVFLLLLAVLWKYAWRPIAEGLDKREKRIADDIAAAEQANEEARQLLAQHRARLDGAEAEVREMIARAQRDAEQAGRELIAKARAETEVEKQRTAGNRCGHVRRPEGTGRSQCGLGSRFGRQDHPIASRSGRTFAADRAGGGAVRTFQRPQLIWLPRTPSAMRSWQPKPIPTSASSTLPPSMQRLSSVRRRVPAGPPSCWRSSIPSCPTFSAASRTWSRCSSPRWCRPRRRSGSWNVPSAERPRGSS